MIVYNGTKSEKARDKIVSKILTNTVSVAGQNMVV